MSVRILLGEVREMLRTLADESVHCVVTSPPYWGLRKYDIPPTVWGGDPDCEHDFATKTIEAEIRTGLGMAALGEKYRGGGHKAGLVPVVRAERGCRCGAWQGDLGLEPTPELYVDHIVEVFRAVRRALRKDGMLWLNLGDCYANDGKWGGETGGKQAYLGAANRQRVGREERYSGLKPKDLIGLPWMIAFALRADGWYLRQDIIWHKANPMPESVTDRCTKSHEYLFFLTKSPRYFFDSAAIAEDAAGTAHSRGSGVNPKAVMGTVGREKQNASFSAAINELVSTRNKRSVWTVATEAFSEAHFATFPSALIKSCILAGTSEKGCCSKCGKPWERQTERSTRFEGGSGKAGRSAEEVNALGKWAGKQYGTNIKLGPVVSTRTIGWAPSCQCGSWTSDKVWESEPCVPCTVLDPFGGAGTTSLVADRLQRNAILIELSETYCDMARRRIDADAPLFAEVAE